MSEYTSILALLAIGLFAVVAKAYIKSAHRRYPPGPPAKPVVGNLLQLPSQNEWRRFTDFKYVYGDLVYFHGLGNKVLMLNSMKAIDDLFEKRAKLYSDRPVFTVVGELMRLDQSTPLMRHGDDWRVHRKLTHSVLGPSAVKQWCPIQEDLAALLAQQFIDNPDGFFDYVRLAAARIVLTVTYGLSVDTADNDYVTHAENTMRMISKTTHPGAFLCDFFPWMKHLPSWLPFQKKAREGKAMIEHLVTKPFEHVKREMEKGTAPPSLAHYLLAEHANGNIEHLIKWATGSLYGAGGETTYATVLTSMMAMALHPEKRKLAQQEIDKVLGTHRLPTISDRSDLPYVNAFIKETMRWNPAVPLGLARCVTQDDVYEGYDIPKGTIVMTNVWSIAFEERGPYDPREFVPERWLTGATGDDAPIDPASWAFGFARRLCPGKHLAENSVFILISTILSVFDVEVPDEGELKPAYTTGLISYPLPFKCKITPRSESKVAQVAYRTAQCSI